MLFNPAPNPDPKLTPEVLGYLRAVFCDEEEKIEASNVRSISTDVQTALEAQVVMEIEKIGKSLLNSHVKMLETLDTPESREQLQKIRASSNPMNEVLTMLEAKKQAENQLDVAIQQEKNARNSELQQLDEDITKVWFHKLGSI